MEYIEGYTLREDAQGFGEELCQQSWPESRAKTRERLLNFWKSKIHYVIRYRVFHSRDLDGDFGLPIPSMICRSGRYWRPIESETQPKWGGFRNWCRRFHLWCCWRDRTQTNCSKTLPKHDQTVFLISDRINPMQIYWRSKQPVAKSKKCKKWYRNVTIIAVLCVGTARAAERRNVCAENEQEKETGTGLFSQW